jgi:hypothetical protein
MRTPKNSFVLFSVSLTTLAAGCGLDLELPTPDDIVIQDPDRDADEPLLDRLLALAPDAYAEAEEVEDPGLGWVSIGDESYPILAAQQTTQQDMGCGPAMVEPEVVFAINGVEQMIHFDLTVAWELPEQETATSVPGELLQYGYAQRCIGDCFVDETFYLGEPEGSARVWTGEQGVLSIRDLEVSFASADNGVPVKVVLNAIDVTNPNY